MKTPFQRHPYAIVLLILLLLSDIGGVLHAFRMHGARDGVIALVLPPYGLYRGVEALTHKTMLTEADAVQLTETDDGRRSLSHTLTLTNTAWKALLKFIESQPGHMLKSTMKEGGTTYNVTLDVQPKNGPVTITIETQTNAALTIAMIDTTRSQQPDIIRTTKHIKNLDDVHTTPLAKFSSEDGSQFLLAWSLALGTIVQEHQAELGLTSR